MGAVISFPEARRVLREPPLSVPRATATVIILPVIRIEREIDAATVTQPEPSKSPPGRKRRRRALPT
jgi:hypothetical protein